jgi:hypothetical protein
MYIFGDLINTLSRTVLAVAVSSVLLLPILLVSVIEVRTTRLAVVLLANALLVTILSLLARLRVGEVFVAGATYVKRLPLLYVTELS